MDNLRGKFIQEATDLIDDLEKAILQLEQHPDDLLQKEEVFRVMHTFKGTAKMFGFDKIGEFTHTLENIYDDLRNHRINITDEILQVTLNSVDHIRHLLNSNEADDEGEHTRMMIAVASLSKSGASKSSSLESERANNALYLIHFRPHHNFLQNGNNPLYLIEDLSALGNAHCKSYTDLLPQAKDYAPDTTYLYWDILLYTTASAKTIRNEFMFVEDRCDLIIEEVCNDNWLSNEEFVELITKEERRLSRARVHEIAQGLFKEESRTSLRTERAEISTSASQTIKVTYDKIDKLMSIVSEMVTTQARLKLLADRTNIPEIDEISENVEKLVRQLRDETFSISLLPISHLSMRFERLVRDTSRALNKRIQFVTIGGETELDKKIIENLMDPMLHILRNSMDHGIESPEERRRKGKNETGTIKLKAFYSGTHVIIEIEDDGAGIDKDRVLQKAIENNLVRKGQQLSESEIYQLIFHPGFSTAKEVTDVSGRGVGMDVVNKAVKNLRGEIEVVSIADKGSVIRLKLPLSLSIMDGLLVKVADSTFVMPLTAIDKCYGMERTMVKPNLNQFVVLDGEQVPYISLRNVFNYGNADRLHVNLIVARHEQRKVAFEVDSIIDEYQAVIKPLGKMYKDQDFASGATILGNGTVALVLDTSRLISTISSN